MSTISQMPPPPDEDLFGGRTLVNIGNRRRHHDRPSLPRVVAATTGFSGDISSIRRGQTARRANCSTSTGSPISLARQHAAGGRHPARLPGVFLSEHKQAAE